MQLTKCSINDLMRLLQNMLCLFMIQRLFMIITLTSSVHLQDHPTYTLGLYQFILVSCHSLQQVADMVCLKSKWHTLHKKQDTTQSSSQIKFQNQVCKQVLCLNHNI